MTLFYSRHSGIGALLYALWFLFGSAMIGAIVLGFGAIRRGDVRRHQVWMARGNLIELGAGTHVLTGMVGALIAGSPSALRGDLLLGAGWVINLAVAEWVIRRRLAPPVCTATNRPSQPRRAGALSVAARGARSA
jgi:hypothetical protein